ncbi:MAG: hypothetical protein HY851_09210 [candidate division Zixibacteria bacterium]|nr:hypothetical protein [candidate division Zixibacteria bacterium]
MKKIIVAIVLLGVLLGIVFVKTNREQSQVDEAFRQGVAKGQLEVAAYHKRLESLRVSTEQFKIAWSDSVRIRDSILAYYRDSVNQIILAQTDKIKELSKKTRYAAKSSPKAAATTSTAQKPDSVAPTSRHAQILAYYKNRYKDLPGDLSVYEKKAALNEIRQETATRFSISLTELNELRKTYKLEF